MRIERDEIIENRRIQMLMAWTSAFLLGIDIAAFCAWGWLPFTSVLLLDLVAMVSLVIHVYRSHRDPFHPIVLFGLSFLLRIGVHAILLVWEVVPPDFLFRQWYEGDAWRKGYLLASASHWALVIGWILIPTLRWHHRKQRPFGVESCITYAMLEHAGKFGMLLGLALYAYFFALNFGNPFSGWVFAVFSGVLRGSAHAGTSRYSYIAVNLLFWSSLLWSAVLWIRTRSVFRALLPPLLVFFLRLPFGGRVNAFAMIFLAFLMFWYMGWKGTWRPSGTRGILLRALGGVVLLALYVAPAVRAYRGSGGLNAFIEMLHPAYVVRDSLLFWFEIGMLHVYTYAISLGEAIHPLPWIRYLVGGYAAYFLGMKDVMVHGTYIVYRLTGVNPGWGLHTGLPVDFYMSFGFWSALVGMAVLGGVIKNLYTNLAVSPEKSVVYRLLYAFLFWTLYWKVYERGLGLFSWVEPMAFLSVILMLGKLFWRKPRKTEDFCLYGPKS